MIGFLADWFPKQVINDKSTLLPNNQPNVFVGSVTIPIGIICSKAKAGLEKDNFFDLYNHFCIFFHIKMNPFRSYLLQFER